jgi:septal ring factor EnvC (AmiA/AmiB activator)
MDVNKILAELRRERAQIEEVIASLEILALSRERRRGRPSAVLVAARKRILDQNRKHPVELPDRNRKADSAPRAMAAGQAVVPPDVD